MGFDSSIPARKPNDKYPGKETERSDIRIRHTNEPVAFDGTEARIVADGPKLRIMNVKTSARIHKVDLTADNVLGR